MTRYYFTFTEVTTTTTTTTTAAPGVVTEAPPPVCKSQQYHSLINIITADTVSMSVVLKVVSYKEECEQ